MNIHTALKKIDKLSKHQLDHMIQLCEIEIVNNNLCVENYSPDDMKKYGIPHLKRLENHKKQFEDAKNAKAT